MKKDTNKTILLVEDETLIAMAEAAHLEKTGYNVITVYTGEAAIEAVESSPEIALILMDIDLGKDRMDGTVTAEHILSGHDLPVVFLSSHMESEIVEKTEKITSYGYIVKDSGYKVLDASIRMALKLFEANQEIKESRKEAEKAYLEMERREERLQHMNRVLLSIRNVNQLITKENDRHRLLQQACRLLIETSGYHSASVILIEDNVPLEPFYYTGPGQNFAPMAEELRAGHIPPCILEALETGKIVLLNSAHHACPGCPLLTHDDYHVFSDSRADGMVTRLEHGGFVYGWIIVSVPRGFLMDEEERQLFREISGDIALALYKNRIEEEKERFNTMLTESREALRKNEDRLQKILTAAQDGTWDWDLNTGTVFFDPRYYEMAGYTFNEFPPEYEEFRKRVHPEDLPLVERTINLHLEGAIDHFSVEFRFLQCNGEWLWILGRGKIVEKNEDGTPARFVGTHTDISRLKQVESRLEEALREKDTLLRELKHRVKNNFNMMTSMIHLKMDTLEDKATIDCLKEVENRINAFSELYTQLYRDENQKEIQLETYLENLITSMNTTAGDVRIRFDLAETTIPMKKAATLGLIVTELVTNALKHSFPDSRHGTIMIKHSEKGSTSVLVVENDGIPFPQDFSIDSSPGLGLKMVRGMVKDLNGTLAIHGNKKSGVYITFKP